MLTYDMSCVVVESVFEIFAILRSSQAAPHKAHAPKLPTRHTTRTRYGLR